jgi:hypothetical protein
VINPTQGIQVVYYIIFRNPGGAGIFSQPAIHRTKKIDGQSRHDYTASGLTISIRREDRGLSSQTDGSSALGTWAKIERMP